MLAFVKRIANMMTTEVKSLEAAIANLRSDF